MVEAADNSDVNISTVAVRTTAILIGAHHGATSLDMPVSRIGMVMLFELIAKCCSASRDRAKIDPEVWSIESHSRTIQ